MEPYFRFLFLLIVFFIGAILGSFACCQAWRIRYKELGKKSPGKWSACLSCGKRLKKSENIPIFSWLAQKGKCKTCGAKIGTAEILSELSLALALPAVANVFYDQFLAILAENQIANLVMLILTALVVLASMTIMWILLIYDAKWQKLPTFLLTILNACAIIHVILQIVGLVLSCVDFSAALPAIGPYLLKILESATILAAPYFLLSFLSKEKLVGSGDWLVALPIALMLEHWWLALIALFIANFAGSIIGLYQKYHNHKKQIAFGPFLIFAFVVVYAAQSWLLTLMIFS